MTEVSNVSVHVFNSQSQLIATLVDGQQEAGVHHATWNTSALPTGMYFVRVESDGKLMQTLKVVIDR
jgi:flagellar hook assembly protein FlgD